MQAAAPPGAAKGFGFVASGQARPADNAPRTAGWRKADLKRAIAVAEEAGLKSYRIEIAPDGTITILVGAAET